MKQNYQDCLRYIQRYWPQLTFTVPKTEGVHLRLPHPFVAPNKYIFGKDQFYWDSYFIILGLVISGPSKVKLAKGMVDNFIHLYRKFKMIPARNRFWNTGISQPPFLTSMMFEVYEHLPNSDKRWLRNVADVAGDELHTYWMNNAPHRAEQRLMYKGLSRYCDHNVTHVTAEHESGWDMTSRFDEKCLNYLPIDLNTLLYRYEIDLAHAYTILGEPDRAALYTRAAAKRKKAIQALMWNEKKGFYFDYDFVQKKQSTFYSLAGFYPLWANLASQEQAEKMRRALKKFEYPGGLANTQKTGLSKEFKQWDYPNGWANQHWIVIRGLLNYGFTEDAERIAYKWLDTNKRVFEKTGKFWEKYNVVTGETGKQGRYAHQEGFGWTNAVFARLVHELFLDEKTQ